MLLAVLTQWIDAEIQDGQGLAAVNGVGYFGQRVLGHVQYLAVILRVTCQLLYVFIQKEADMSSWPAARGIEID